MISSDIHSLGFNLVNNVEIEVVNPETKVIRQRIKIHNKATRRMVEGLLRFMNGHFTDTNLNKKPQYQSAKDYIPCFIGFGDGGILYDSSGMPSPITILTPSVPKIEDSWNEYVPYTSTGMVRELEWVNERSKINKVTDTYTNEATADMDSLYFHCEVAPTSLNGYRPQSEGQQEPTFPVYLTEVGLFSGNIPGERDMLAYIKLSNYTDPTTGNIKSRILYVRPSDTVIIRWVITIAAIGKDSILRANVLDENGRIVTNDVVMIPEVNPVVIEPYPNQNNS